MCALPSLHVGAVQSMALGACIWQANRLILGRILVLEHAPDLIVRRDASGRLSLELRLVVAHRMSWNACAHGTNVLSSSRDTVSESCCGWMGSLRFSVSAPEPELAAFKRNTGGKRGTQGQRRGTIGPSSGLQVQETR